MNTKDDIKMIRRPLRLLIPVLITGLSMIIWSCDSLSDDSLETAPIIPVSVDVKYKIGELLYENLDANVTVRGYSESEALEWSQVFEYKGGSPNVLEIPGKYHHYKFSVEKWGHTDEQPFSILQLNELRANGPSPGVLVLGGEIAAKKLKEVVSYLSDGEVETPVNRTIYFYDETGRLTRRDRKTYNAELQDFTLSEYTTFAYENNRVKTLRKYDATVADPVELKELTTYEYNTAGNISRMILENYGAGITTTADLAYGYSPAGTVTVTYSNSNGTGLTYQITLQDKNIISETVTTGGSLCQDADFTYDKNINPYRHLGFVDIFFSDYSANNRLTEAVEYKCSYPSMIPESYDYEYDEKGYPIESVTHLKGGGNIRQTFEYK